MKKYRIRRYICILLVIVLSAALITPAVLADDSEIHIKTAEDLRKLSSDCRLDTYSVGLSVYLDNDIDLKNEPFYPIPTFSGKFYGQNHTVNGFVLATDGSHQGLFRYLEEGSCLWDLTVKGTVEPKVGMNEVGGIVGTNHGTIVNCSFSGTVSGEFFVGGIAGTSTGEITNCTSNGKVNGKRCTGGIVGHTTALVSNCKNLSAVNTVVTEGNLKIDDLNLTGLSMTNLSSVDNTSFVSDTGGIVGFAQEGIIECMNYGTVGYQHYGYNVGGIVGRSDRYVSSCSNFANVYGRKDVGGIIGHQEPSKKLTSQTDLGTELARLNVITLETLYHAIDYTDDIDTALDKVNRDARSASQKIAPEPNGITLSPDIMTLNAVTPKRTLTVYFEEGVEPQKLVFTMGDNSIAQIYSGPVETEEHTYEYEIIGCKEGSTTLSAVTADGLHSSNSISIVVTGINSVSKIKITKEPALEAHYVGDLVTLVADVSPADATNPEIKWSVNNSDTDKVRIVTGGISEDTQRCIVECTGKGIAKVIATAADGGGASDTTLLLIQERTDDKGKTDGQEVLPLTETSGEAKATPDPVPTSLPVEQPQETVPPVQPAAEPVTETVPDTQPVVSPDMQPVIPTDTQPETDTIVPAPPVEAYSHDVRSTGSVRFGYNGLSFQWPPEGLSTDFRNLSDDFDELNDALDRSSDIMLDDLTRVTNQLSLVLDIMNRVLTRENLNIYRDVSRDYEVGDPEGKVMGCVNNGAVEGDSNVGGIVGDMGVEYEFDMSDSIISEVLGLSLDGSTVISKYDAKCIEVDNINNGTVVGRKDNIGSVIGQMEFGIAEHCQGYGSAESTDGGYVGGIVGRSNKTIRSCYSMCQLSGVNNVGGIAGYGVEIIDCHTLVGINNVTAFVGAIAGTADINGVDSETGKPLVRGNSFAECGFGAIDGISYSGHAEQVSYEAMLENESIPEMFRELKLTFMANGVVVKEIPFTYGGSVDEKLIPEVPPLSGFNGRWQEHSFSGLTFSDTIEAVYTSRQASMAVAETRDDSPMPIVLLEGDFNDNARVLMNEYSGSEPDTDGTIIEKRVVRIENDDLSGRKYSLRYLVPAKGSSAGKVIVYVLDNNNNWRSIETHRNGSYEAFECEGNTVVFSAVEEQSIDYRRIVIYAGAGVVTLIILVVLFSSIKKRKKKAFSRT